MNTPPPPPAVLDTTHAPFYKWFVGGRTNTCYNAVDRHVEAGRGSAPALIYDSAVTGAQRVYSYAELLEEVCVVAVMLLRRGGGVLAHDPRDAHLHVDVRAYGRGAQRRV